MARIRIIDLEEDIVVLGAALNFVYGGQQAASVRYRWFSIVDRTP